jgi:6-pyruvoyl-tetrahydropterin synthase
MTDVEVELSVKKDYFKFNAAHFVIGAEGREALHGHNYTVAVSHLVTVAQSRTLTAPA